MGCPTRRDFLRVGMDAADIGCFGPMKSERPLHAVEVPTLAKIARVGQPELCQCEGEPARHPAAGPGEATVSSVGSCQFLTLARLARG
jgi:hypothetical protein